MKTLNILAKIFLGVILLLGCLVIHPYPVFAHRPHDVIETLAVSPNYQQDKTVYIIVRGMPMKSADGGKSWQRMVTGLNNQGDPVFLAISPTQGSTLYMSTPWDGIYKSEDAGTSWLKVNTGLSNLNIRRLAISPTSADLVLAAAHKQELYYTDNGGQTWQSVLKVPGAITALSFSPTQTGQVLAGDNQGKIYFSSNSGQTWQTLPRQLEGAETITSLAFANDNNWFIGTNKRGLFQTRDSGLTIEQLTAGITDKNIRDIVVSPNYKTDKKIIISTWNDGTFISNNQGRNWQKSNQGLTKDEQADVPQFSTPHFSYLGVAPTFAQDKTLYLAGFDGLFLSQDSGKTWQELPTLSIRAVTALGISPDYAKDQSLAVGTYEGEAYLSEDAGKSWQSIINGLSVVKRDNEAGEFSVHDPRFFDLEFSPGYSADNTLFSSLILNPFN